MRPLVSVLLVALISLVAYRLFLSKAVGPGTGATPQQTIDAVGAKNDLLSIAQAERTYFPEHGSYASFDQLVSSGALSMKRPSRAGYSYSVETSATGFTVSAKCITPPSQPCTSYAVDQNMEVHAVP
jgi:hypothetical protein